MSVGVERSISKKREKSLKKETRGADARGSTRASTPWAIHEEVLLRQCGRDGCRFDPPAASDLLLVITQSEPLKPLATNRT